MIADGLPPGGDGTDRSGPYEKTGLRGERLKSVTAALPGPRGGAPASMLCINLDVSHLDAALRIAVRLRLAAAAAAGIAVRADWREQIQTVVFVGCATPAEPRSSPVSRSAHCPGRTPRRRGLFEARRGRPCRALLGVARTSFYNYLRAAGLARVRRSSRHERAAAVRLERFFSTREFTARQHMTASDAESLSCRICWRWPRRPTRGVRDPVAGLHGDLGRSGSARGDRRDLLRARPGGYPVLCRRGGGDLRRAHTLLGPDDPRHRAHAHLSVPGDHRRVVCAVSGRRAGCGRRWSLDIDAATRAIRPNTRLVVIQLPNNPTGRSWRDRSMALVTLSAQGDLAVRRRGLPSRWVRRGPSIFRRSLTSMSVDFARRAVESLWIARTSYRLAGLRRTGPCCKRFEQAKHYLSICNSGPSERLRDRVGARHALLARNCACQPQSRAPRGFLRRASGPVRLASTRQGLRRFPALPRRRGRRGFCQQDAGEAGVLLLPASSFDRSTGRPRKTRFRIGFGRDGLQTGLAAFASSWIGLVLDCALVRARSSDETARQSKGVAILLRAAQLTGATSSPNVSVSRVS